MYNIKSNTYDNRNQYQFQTIIKKSETKQQYSTISNKYSYQSTFTTKFFKQQNHKSYANLLKPQCNNQVFQSKKIDIDKYYSSKKQYLMTNKIGNINIIENTEQYLMQKVPQKYPNKSNNLFAYSKTTKNKSYVQRQFQQKNQAFYTKLQGCQKGITNSNRLAKFIKPVKKQCVKRLEQKLDKYKSYFKNEKYLKQSIQFKQIGFKQYLPQENAKINLQIECKRERKKSNDIFFSQVRDFQDSNQTLETLKSPKEISSPKHLISQSQGQVTSEKNKSQQFKLNEISSQSVRYSEKSQIKNEKSQQSQKSVKSKDSIEEQMSIKSQPSQSNKHIELSLQIKSEGNIDIRNLKVQNFEEANNVKILTKLSDFIILTKKGVGRLGQILVAIHKQTQGVFAIKKMNKKAIIQDKIVDYVANQIKIQSFLNDPNIVKLYGIFDDQFYIYLIMQYLEDGSLQQLLQRHKYHTYSATLLTQQESSKILKDILSGLSYLHQQQIIHRDLKPGNIVISNNVCKICDFGWAVRNPEKARRVTYCGTFDYAPPQIFNGQQYNLQVDLWQLGVLAYQLICGRLPFYTSDPKKARERVINYSGNLNYPIKISNMMKNFIQKLLQKNPDHRMSAAQLLKHPLIKQFNILQQL